MRAADEICVHSAVDLITASAWSQKASAVESARDLASSNGRNSNGIKGAAQHIQIPNTKDALRRGDHAGDAGSVGSRLRGRNQGYGIMSAEQTTVLQLIRSFVTYARSHPAELEGILVAVFKALQHAFPCR